MNLRTSLRKKVIFWVNLSRFEGSMLRCMPSMSRSRASPRRSWHSWGCVEKRCRWYSLQAFLREGRGGGGEGGGRGGGIEGEAERERGRRERVKRGREGDREDVTQKAVVELESFTLNTEY